MDAESTPHPVKILIVDDKQSNLIAMQAGLKGCGYEIIEALSGKEALRLVKEHSFACILLDVQMPFMDGFETAIHIRRSPLSQNTPIIFATAIHRTEEYEEFGYGAGAVDYLFKPINTKILQAKVAIFVALYLQSEEIKNKNLLLEEALVKANENKALKDALSARDEFISMASHELKTPITPLTLQMQTFIDLMERGGFDSVEPERLLRMLKTSQGQVGRLSRLVNELVDVSRTSTDKLELNKSKFDLCSLIKKVVVDFAEEIERSGSSVSLEAHGTIEGYWDAFRIEQIVVNLLINSLKYGLRKPVRIEVSKVNENSVKFCFYDQGIGIAEENLKRIFNRFERAVSNTNYSGLGLGLYISEQIVLRHNGKITVESELEKGSAFIVELPLFL